jgi:hypothetical protein
VTWVPSERRIAQRGQASGRPARFERVTDESQPGQAGALDEDPADVLAELIAREPIFHRPEHGTRRADFAAMITDDYWEVGASGRRYTREYVLDALVERHRRPHADRWDARDFAVRRLGPAVYLLTYALAQGDRHTRRATVWERGGRGWRAIYHQGTLVEYPVELDDIVSGESTGPE